MKKIIMLIFSIFLLVGCNDLMNTPTKRVEEFLTKYQTLDSEVMNQLSIVLEEDYALNETQKEKYVEVMKKQYQNLVYVIKEETVDGDNATVKVEIEVMDLHKVIKDADVYLTTNQAEFLKEDGSIDSEKFMNYKIEQLGNASEKVKYTIEFTLTKNDSAWQMDDITEIDRQKIHGIYSY